MLRNLRELYQYRALLYSLVVRELQARYRASVLGFLWTFLNPLLQMVVYTAIFSYVQKTPVRAYAFFLFVGLLPWIYFSSSLGAGASSISDRRDLLTKVRFPAQVLPATVVLTNLINFALSLPLLFALGLFLGDIPTWHALLFFLIVLVQTFFTLALVYLVSAFNVAFRDLQHIVSNLLLLFFFLTPVLWKLQDHTPEMVQIELMANPMAVIITAYRDVFYDHKLPDFMGLLRVSGISLVLLWLSSLVFERRREAFAELI